MKKKRCAYCKQKKTLKNFELHKTGSKRLGKRRSECNDCRKQNRISGVSNRRRTVKIQDYIKLQRLLCDIGFAIQREEKDLKNIFIEQIEKAIYRFEKCNRCQKSLKGLNAYFPICENCAADQNDLNDLDLVQEQEQELVEKNKNEQKIINVENVKNNENPIIKKTEEKKKINIKDLLWLIYNKIERNEYPECRNGDCEKKPHIRPMQCLDVQKKDKNKRHDHYKSVWNYCYHCKKNYYLCQKNQRIAYIRTYLQQEDPEKMTVLYYYIYQWANYLNKTHNVNIKTSPYVKKLKQSLIKKMKLLRLKNKI